MTQSRLFAVFAVSAALVTSILPTAAHAVDLQEGPALWGNPGVGGSMFSLGALAGFGFLSAGGGTQLVVGVNGNYKLAPTYGVGGYITYNSFAATAPATASVITIAPEANYYFEGALTGFRAGGKVGLSFLNQSSGTTSPITATGATDDTSTGLVLGPHLGYDYGLGGGLSFGGEANILFHTQSNGFNAVNLLANLKYWF